MNYKPSMIPFRVTRKLMRLENTPVVLSASVLVYIYILVLSLNSVSANFLQKIDVRIGGISSRTRFPWHRIRPRPRYRLRLREKKLGVGHVSVMDKQCREDSRNAP